MLKSIRHIFLMIIVLSIMLFIFACGSNGAAPKPKIGDKAPNFTLENVDGQKIGLTDFQGKVVLIVFRKVYCQGCELQKPYIDTAYNEAAGNLVVLNIYREDTPASVKKHVEEENLTRYPALADTRDEVAERFGLQKAAPINVIIDSEGIIKAIRPGPFNNVEEIKSWLE